MIVSILIFLVIFLVIVVSHEFGHYIIGKMNGIHAVEFFVGMGPKLFHWKKDDTEFSIRAFPFGGACVFDGMDDLRSMDSLDNAEDETGNGIESEKVEVNEAVRTFEYSEGSYLKASALSRFATTLAGPLFNVILAYVCGVILSASTGEVIPVIQSVMENSGAYEAGLLPEDQIVKINGHAIHLSSEVSFYSYYSSGEPMNVVVLRDGKKMKFTVVPKYSDEDQRYYIGITNGEYIKVTPLQSLKYGFYNVEYILRASVDSIRMMFTGRVNKDDLAGPVGMVKVVDETYTEAKSYGVMTVVMSMLNLTLLLSANLAVMNLLPIPGLDGGKLLFIILEMIRRKPISPEKEGYVTLAGMALLLMLVVFVFFNDISKFFR